MAVIGINYDGFNHDYDENGERFEIPGGLKYESVYIHHNAGEKIFDSGDFVKDWYGAIKFYHKELYEQEFHLSESSSCHHFHTDGADFDEAYLHIIDDKPILKYLNKEDEHWFITQRDIYEKGIEYFVETGTQPTWEELKKYCEGENVITK